MPIHAFPTDTPHFVAVRTDRIGDLLCTLPALSVLRQNWPRCRITLVVRTPLAPLAQLAQQVDAVIAGDAANFRALQADCAIFFHADASLAKAAKAAGVPVRIGTFRRLARFTLPTHNVPRAANHTRMHEIEQTMRLLEPLGVTYQQGPFNAADLYKLKVDDRTQVLPAWVGDARFKLLLQPLTGGSAPAWPLDRYLDVVKQLDPARFLVIVHGSAAEGEQIRAQCPGLLAQPNVVAELGTLSLAQLAAVIDLADGVLGASTGPIHLGAALGRHTLALHGPGRGFSPVRWGPVGRRAEVLCIDRPTCEDCRRTRDCHCIREIGSDQVLKRVQAWAEPRT
jgi:ADP-heptose:LPS heptosyltransferase